MKSRRFIPQVEGFECRLVPAVVADVVAAEARTMEAAAAPAAFEPLTFPDLKTVEGAITAFLLVENNTPFIPGYNAAEIQTSMRAMKAVVYNRLRYPELNWGVTNPTSPLDIIGAPAQYEGFRRTADGVAISKALETRINNIIKFTNTKNAKQTEFQTFVTNIRNVVNSPVDDPFVSFGGSFGWGQLNFKEPGGYQVRIPAPDGVIQGNKFYTVRGVDLVFVIDETGSMGDDIGAVKEAANKIITDAIRAKDDRKDAPNTRFAVVTYRDPGEVRVVTPFTKDKDTATAIAGINTITVGGGGDTPEGVGSGLFTAASGGAGAWRALPIARRIILLGDAPAKDPATVSQALGIADDKTIEIEDKRRIDAVPAARLTALSATTRMRVVAADPIRIYSVAIGSDSQAIADFRNIAQQSQGQFFAANSATDVVGVLSEAIRAAVLPPPVLPNVAAITVLPTGSNQTVLQITFNTTVSITGGAFSLQTSTGQPVSFSRATSTVAGKTVVRLLFNNVSRSTRYQLGIDSTRITANNLNLDGDNDGVAGGDKVFDFSNMNRTRWAG